MTHVGYLIAGWGGSLAAIGLYARYVVVKGKELTAEVPPGHRRWTEAEGAQRV